MEKYIEYAKQTPYFGMTFFDMRDNTGSELTVGIAEDGIFLFKVSNLVYFFKKKRIFNI